MKGNRRPHLDDYRKVIRRNGEMMVNDVSELIDLGHACHPTLSIHSERQAQQRVAYPACASAGRWHGWMRQAWNGGVKSRYRHLT